MPDIADKQKKCSHVKLGMRPVTLTHSKCGVIIQRTYWKYRGGIVYCHVTSFSM